MIRPHPLSSPGPTGPGDGAVINSPPTRCQGRPGSDLPAEQFFAPNALSVGRRAFGAKNVQVRVAYFQADVLDYFLTNSDNPPRPVSPTFLLRSSPRRLHDTRPEPTPAAIETP